MGDRSDITDINLAARGFEGLLQPRPMPFTVPMIDRASNPKGFDFVWQQIHYAFDLPNPAKFPPLSGLSAEELSVLQRFVVTAEKLAASTLLNASDGVTIHFSGADNPGLEKIETNWSAADVTTGFATLFRQIYADDEKASFNTVQGILMRHTKATADADTETRDAMLRAWGSAVGKSRQQSVRKSALLKMMDEGLMPPLPEKELEHYPDPEPPAKTISTYFYGDHIHWDDKQGHASVVSGRDPFDDAWYRMAFLEAVAGLSHLFIGYAVLVRTAASL
jgi:hypothetical protein